MLMPKLIISKKDGTDVAELLDQNVIGRGIDTTIRIDDIQASRKHCKISKTDEGYLLEDLESGNGTYVNGKFTKHQLLKEGDQVKIGATLLTFTDGAVKVDKQGKIMAPPQKIDPNLVKGETIRTFVTPAAPRIPTQGAPGQASPLTPARPPITRMPVGASTTRTFAGAPTSRAISPTTKIGGTQKTSRTVAAPLPQKKSPVMLIISILVVVVLGVVAFFALYKPKAGPDEEDEKQVGLILTDIINQKINSPYRNFTDRDNVKKYRDGLFEGYEKMGKEILDVSKDDEKRKWFKDTKAIHKFHDDMVKYGKYTVNIFDWGKHEDEARKNVPPFLAKAKNPPDAEGRKLYDEAVSLSKEYADTTFQFDIEDAVEVLKKYTQGTSQDEIEGSIKLAEKVNKEYLPNEKFSQAIKELKEFLAKTTKDIAKTTIQDALTKANSAAEAYKDKVLKDIDGITNEDAIKKLTEAQTKLEGTDYVEPIKNKLKEKEEDAKKQGSAPQEGQQESSKENKQQNKSAENPK